MDRVNELRGEGGGQNSFDSNSSSCDDYLTANESSSKFFSFTEVESSFDIAPVITEDSPSTSAKVPKKPELTDYKLGKQIEAANILSGGVEIFDDNDTSCDGNDLVIDDNASQDDVKVDQKVDEHDVVAVEPTISVSHDETAIPSKDTEVLLQIDGKNVDAIDIGNGLYLYRRNGEQEELSAVQIIDSDSGQPTFKFLKVRENAEGNLEVYEEIVEVHKEVPEKETKLPEKTMHVPIKDINQVINDYSSTAKVTERKSKDVEQDSILSGAIEKETKEKEVVDSKTELNLNGKMMKFTEARKSPVIGSFTPMTFHSTPNKERIPLTKTMVDQQLHPSRHSDMIKKKIEVNTDSNKPKLNDMTKSDSDESAAIGKEQSEEVSDSNHIRENDVENDVKQDHVDDVLSANDSESKTCDLDDANTKVDVEKLPQTVEIEGPPVIDIKDSKDSSNAVELPNIVESNEPTPTAATEPKNCIKIAPNSISPVSESIENIDVSVSSNIETCDAISTNISLSKSEETPPVINIEKTEPIVENTKPTVQESKPIVTEDTSLLKSESEDQIQKNKTEDAAPSLDKKTVTDSQKVSSSANVKKENTKCSTEKANSENTNKTIESKIDIINSIAEPTKAKTNLDNKDVKDVQISKISTCNKEDTKTNMVNNNNPVPFGQWTEANKQEYLIKINKETKIPINSANTNQIKQPNDLNRRDVLKKIGNARQLASNNVLQSKDAVKTYLKKESPTQEKNIFTSILEKTNVPETENKTESSVLEVKPKTEMKTSEEPSKQKVAPKTEHTVQRTEINNQDLIDRTIDGILADKLAPQAVISETDTKKSVADSSTNKNPQSNSKLKDDVKFHDLEMKMNELHGMPFIERPIHELPQRHSRPVGSKVKSEIQSKLPVINKGARVSTSQPLVQRSKPKVEMSKVTVNVDDSDDEVIECQPVTGDIDSKRKQVDLKSDRTLISSSSRLPFVSDKSVTSTIAKNVNKVVKVSNDDSIITEKEFDKFARRNSITYENCITVNFDSKQKPNIMQTSNLTGSRIPKNEKLFKPIAFGYNEREKKRHSNTSDKNESQDKNYASNLKLAYNSALTAKKHKESPITAVIEDKPVKVVFNEFTSDFVPYKLDVQGQKLSAFQRNDVAEPSVSSPAKDTIDADISEIIKEDVKSKSKHQRKQVLTPVEAPEMELIEPKELGLEPVHKKKRKDDLSILPFEEQPANKKSMKAIVPKKSYLLGRNAVSENLKGLFGNQEANNEAKTPDVNVAKEQNLMPIIEQESFLKDPVSNTIDNLVKAAELLDKQTEAAKMVVDSQPAETPPIKRGRGRPRKHPIEDTTPEKRVLYSPQKKLKTVETKSSTSDEFSSGESDEEGLKVNWTMGKINENIVCPICHKLFRTENVVFKHVKHCSGPSPNRSHTPTDLDLRLPKSPRQSSDDSQDIDFKKDAKQSETPKRPKSPENRPITKLNEVIEIESSPEIELKEKRDGDNVKQRTKTQRSNLVCEICGKKFNQLSNLVSHKLLHKKDETVQKKAGSDDSTFSCESCKKEFRKLHHLVQHRLIHKPKRATLQRENRKSAAEQNANKNPNSAHNDSAGFRCEPCDKSFRKLHHLVEHRETHDGINKQKSTSTTVVAEKPAAPHCDICNKTFRKRHHLIEHQGQHKHEVEEKKKNSLLAKDIIHECPLCYMVFPNEHSLNKHNVNCQRKKRQSATKKPVADEEAQIEEESEVQATVEKAVEEEIVELKEPVVEQNRPMESEPVIEETKSETPQVEEKIPEPTEPVKEIVPEPAEEEVKASKKTPNKDKVTVSKRLRSSQQFDEKKPKSEPGTEGKAKRQAEKSPEKTGEKSEKPTSDDDEIRYMINPAYVPEISDVFMKIRANKRNSLQIERPKLKAARRISLQNPPKLLRVKGKKDESEKKPVSRKNSVKEEMQTSDDNEIKYSFPKIPKSELDKQPQKTVGNKRKSVAGVVAKRKTLEPQPKLKKQSAGVRCDCGQLFGSRALLERHTTLVHTPPRRARRHASPPKPKPAETKTKPAEAKPKLAETKPKPTDTKAKPAETKAKPAESKAKLTTREIDKSAKKAVTKQKRTSAHRGVPVPDKMKKLFEKRNP